MTTYYVIRVGHNAANQSAMGRPAKPKNDFESGRYKLVAIVEAESAEDAKESAEVNVYNDQHLIAVANPRAYAGLTAAIAKFGH